MNSVFDRYEPYKGEISSRTRGVLVAFEPGVSVTYGLYNAQERGELLIGPGVEVYEGMIVGINSRNEDIAINVCKEKHLTNTRASGSDDALRLVPPLQMSLEKAIEFISKKLASGKRIHELELLKRTLQYHHGIIGRLRKYLSEKYHCEMDEHCMENVINMMTNEFPTSAAKKTYAQCVFLKKEQDDYGISDVYGKMLQNPEFCAILEELVDFGISRYKVNYSYHYQDTNLVLYQKYTYEDACRLLNWERNEVPLNIGGYKYDKKTKTFPIFINYDKQDNISDTTKYEDHFVAENRMIAISKSGRSMDAEDVQNFLNATERGIDVQLFVRKNKDDKISKEFYYLGRVIATGNAKQFVMPNTDKTAVEIEWELETPVREDIYQYIVNE